MTKFQISFGYTVRLLGEEEPFLTGGSDTEPELDVFALLFGLLESDIPNTDEEEEKK